ncbi:MAG: valine--tRNA ligase [Candidatus Hydrogenedentes bacterium]|nr:valine--tRNA ligase [Candidatus Hydrogenedentota bacterium]
MFRKDGTMELPKNYEFKSIEEYWMAKWLEDGIYKWDSSKNREETFVVDTPPPTVSGSLHVGHMFSYSHQDFIVRYQRMKGKNIFFPIGWDDNGLPTERRVQNYLNVRCDPSLPYDPNLKIEIGRRGPPISVSRKNFIELCDKVVVEDEKAFRSLWTRLGMSYDWSLEYATIDKHCRLISQASFIELYKRGEIYQEERPVLWDVDYQTAIAQAEIVDKEVPSAYYYFRFPIKDSQEYLVIATTRPELLPACVAVLVHPDDERYKRYIGKIALTPMFSVPVPIMADEKAEPEKGTGVVMVCTFGDQTDVEWWKKFNLPLRQIVGKNGSLLPLRFISTDKVPSAQKDESGNLLIPSISPDIAVKVYEEIRGLYVGDAKKRIVEIAKNIEGVIDRPEMNIVHPVKYFEKGEKPLEIIPTRQWYTRIIDKKEVLIEQGRKIKWYPEYMYKRYEHWVEGLNQDWCLSRQRFFGVPIPVWYPLNSVGEVIFGKPILPDISELPVDPLSDVPKGFSSESRDKPNGFTGEPDVLDTWATSALTPQIASHWFLNLERHKKLFPMDIRPQAHDIIRTWAFYTIVKAYLHEQEIPWKNIVLSGWILDPDRKKMSKSHGNVVTPEPLINQHGADSVRYWAGKARLGVDTAYDEQAFKVGRKLCTKIFNASKFVITQIRGIEREVLKKDRITHQIDLAVIQELKECVMRATDSFEEFDYAQALTLTEEFFWGTFCDNYLEIVKPRTYKLEVSEDKLSACSALRFIHRVLLRLFAPFLPYITEEIWSWEYSKDEGMHTSIHRSPWPSLVEFEGIQNCKFDKFYELMVQIITPIRKAKTEANISMAAPVKKVVVKCSEKNYEISQIILPEVCAMLKVGEYDFDIDNGNESFEVFVEI